MDTTTLIDHLAEQGAAVPDAVTTAGWDAPVPRLDWTIRDAVAHLGGVHRWAAQIVRTGADSFGAVPFENAPGGDELLE